MNNNYLVSIRCMTYNHAAYIENAMNGFCMQETSFPYVAIIVDDASTDGESNAIQDYLNLHFDIKKARQWDTEDATFIEAVHLTNKKCHFAVVLLKQNLHRQKHRKVAMIKKWESIAKYRATCEGDDYWTDPNKLQMQVDFLESHPEYSMCFHNAIEHYENGKIKDKLFSQIDDKDYTDIDIISHWIVPTASVVYRNDIMISQAYQMIINDIKPLFGDTPFFVTAAQFGKVRGLSRVMSVYRRQETGAVFNNVFDNPQKRDKILKDYYLIAKSFGPHLMTPIISKYIQYGYEYKQPKYFAKAFIISPIKAIITVFKGINFMIKNKLS